MSTTESGLQVAGARLLRLSVQRPGPAAVGPRPSLQLPGNTSSVGCGYILFQENQPNEGAVLQCGGGGSGGLDNIASDPLDSAKSFLQMSDLFTGPPRSPKGPAIMAGSAMTLKLKHYAFCDQSWRRMK